MNRPSLSIIAAMGVAILLAGCSTPAGLKAFQRDATADDQLPAGIDVPDNPKMEEVRLLANADGIRYYAAQAEGSGLTCLLKVPEDTAAISIAGCGGSTVAGQIITISGVDGSAATLVTDGFETTELEAQGWRKVHENVLVATVPLHSPAN
jgi:hypothetical protein